jgi:ABC-type uncharacterized transport system auxiliary subunit
MFNGTVRAIAASAVFLSALAAGACESMPVDITDYSLKPVSVGMLVNEDVTIKAVDGSFTLQPNAQFTSPFQANIWAPPPNELSDENIVEGFQRARELGGRDVMVQVKGQAKPLYGVLVLSSIYGAVTGPASRSYQITIPQDKIAAAYAGRTSVVYENGSYVERYDTGYSSNKFWRTWVLWLSATPL